MAIGLVFVVLVVCTATALVPGSKSRAGAVSVAWPDVDAGGLMVMEVGSGRPVYSKEPDRRLKPASTTKIMTAILAIESGRLDDVVTVSRNASRIEGSRIFLEEGEKQTLRDLVYALMLVSANDAAVAIAEHLAGSVQAFAELMNRKAREIGCTGTHFVNPHGLDHPNHYTTARDLALIARYAMQNPTFRQLVATREWQMPWPAKNSTRTIFNENRLLYSEDGTGVKTGYTTAAGHCMVASAKRGDLEVLVVLLDGQPSFWRDIRRLIDFFFEEYSPWVMVARGQELGTTRVGGLVFRRELKGVAGSNLVVPLSRIERDAVAGRLASGAPVVRATVLWREGLRLPVQAGELVGTARVELDSSVGVVMPPFTVPVVASDSVASAWPHWVGRVAVGFGVLALIGRRLNGRNRRRRRPRRRPPWR